MELCIAVIEELRPVTGKSVGQEREQSKIFLERRLKLGLLKKWSKHAHLGRSLKVIGTKVLTRTPVTYQ